MNTLSPSFNNSISRRLVVGLFFLIGSTSIHCFGSSDDNSFASDLLPVDQVPSCMSGSTALPLDNALAVQMKEDHSQYPNGHTYRANISGSITKLYKDATCHTHFEITLDATPSTTIEVIYDQGFGATPTPTLGMSVQACGDFIISYAKENGYAPSPDGALIHWIHASDTTKHDNGFLILDETLCGQDIGSTAGKGSTCK